MGYENLDEVTRVAQQILNMQVNGIITKEQALVAIKKLDVYKEILTD